MQRYPVDHYTVVKNPLSPVEHPGGVGVNCELFELGVEQFVVSGSDSTVVHFAVLISAIADCNSAELIELCNCQACWHTELNTSKTISLGFRMHIAHSHLRRSKTSKALSP